MDKEILFPGFDFSWGIILNLNSMKKFADHLTVLMIIEEVYLEIFNFFESYCFILFLFSKIINDYSESIIISSFYLI